MSTAAAERALEQAVSKTPPPSIRDRIHAIRVQLRGDVTPELVRDAALELAALSSHIRDEVRHREQDYRQVFLNCKQSEKTAAAAKIVAETTPAYWRYREAQDVMEDALLMERTCRHVLQSLNEELRLAR